MEGKLDGSRSRTAYPKVGGNAPLGWCFDIGGGGSNAKMERLGAVAQECAVVGDSVAAIAANMEVE